MSTQQPAKSQAWRLFSLSVFARASPDSDHFQYVHVNDAPTGREIDEQIDEERLLPGTSKVIDIVAFLQALDYIGYSGPVVVEPFNAEVNMLPAQDRVRVAGQSLTQIWQQAGLNKHERKI